MKGIEVRVRHEDYPEGRLLCEVPWGTDLDTVIGLVKSWGVNADEDWVEMSGQFDLTSKRTERVAFEVVLHSTEA